MFCRTNVDCFFRTYARGAGASATARYGAFVDFK